jgi:hypothetical protein
MDRLSWRVALRRGQRDLELHAAVVGRWNAQIESEHSAAPRTIERFLEFVSTNQGSATGRCHPPGRGDTPATLTSAP